MQAARRLELRQANVAAWTESSAPSITAGAQLDSSLKRNTALIKRLRTSLHLPESLPVLLKEIPLLSVDKYAQEITAATVEGVSRCKSTLELANAIEVASCLHARLGAATDFTTGLIAALTAQLKPPSKAALAALQPDHRDKEESSRIVKQRGLLRLVAELEAVGLVSKDGKHVSDGEETHAILRDLLSADKDALATAIPLATTFCKSLGALYLPVISQEPTPSEGQQLEADQLIPIAQQQKFHKLLVSYYTALSKHAIRSRLSLLEQDKRNHEAYIRSGEIFEDRASTYERLVKTWEKEWAGVQSLAELLHEQVPELPVLKNTTVVTGPGISLGRLPGLSDDAPLGDGAPGTRDSPWTDEEERRFYEDVLDLKDDVPAALLGVATTGEESYSTNTESTTMPDIEPSDDKPSNANDMIDTDPVDVEEAE